MARLRCWCTVYELKACWVWSVYLWQRSDRLWPEELVHGRVEVPKKVCIGAIVAICGMPGSASVKLHGDCAFERIVVRRVFYFGTAYPRVCVRRPMQVIGDAVRFPPLYPPSRTSNVDGKRFKKSKEYAAGYNPSSPPNHAPPDSPPRSTRPAASPPALLASPPHPSPASEVPPSPDPSRSSSSSAPPPHSSSSSSVPASRKTTMLL